MFSDFKIKFDICSLFNFNIVILYLTENKVNRKYYILYYILEAEG